MSFTEKCILELKTKLYMRWIGKNKISFIFTAFFLIVVFVSCSTEKKKSTKVSKLNTIDTNGNAELINMYSKNLIGEYKIRLSIDDSLYTLHLEKDTLHKIISQSEKAFHINMLGWVEADFKNYFVLVSKIGGGFPGNPMPCKLIKKENGENVLEKFNGFFIDASEKNNFLLYSENDVPNEGDSIILIDFKQNLDYYKFEIPKELFQEPGVLNRIRFSTIRSNYFIISYLIGKKEMQKKFYLNKTNVTQLSK